MMSLRRVVLEVSLKPFFRVDGLDLDAVSAMLFAQWRPLLAAADEAAVLLWAADGSEILEYQGSLDQPLEWARYIGGANPKRNLPGDPHGRGLHSTNYPYRPDPPALRYRDLAAVAASLKRVGSSATGKDVRVGATFDPGPEFARSDFKYHRHPEICLAGTMGDCQHRFVTCYATLHADDRTYAGFPGGIAEGTSLGTFLGRQCNHFLRDLDLDYVWFSNGFGFGTETWASTGTLFSGREFQPGQRRELAQKNLGFWRDFRAVCSFPVETRGTNLSLGVDWATDAVPVKDLYQGRFNFACPPNSPWAAIDGDFGLELVGYLSRIARLPSDQPHFPFRFYTLDPWWLNSPWLDRYGRQPHDIYLPLAISRITPQGTTQTADRIELLTVDDSYGLMPPAVANEVAPHLLRACADRPDAAGPVVWLYPFDQLDAMTFGEPPRLSEVFFHDQILRGAVNQGLPVNTVIDAAAALPMLADPFVGPLAGRVLLSRTPDADDPLTPALLNWMSRGGHVLLYGPTHHAAPALRQALNLRCTDALDGEMTVTLSAPLDALPDGSSRPGRVIHRALLCGGGCGEILADPSDADTHVLASVHQHDLGRIAALTRAVGRGRAAWVRGTIGYDFAQGGIGVVDDPASHFPAEALFRLALAELGLVVRMGKADPQRRSAMTCIARHDNAWFFSGYTPDTTVQVGYRLPLGAPLLVGMESQLIQGRSHFHMPRAWHAEARVLIEQHQGVVSCLEQCSGEIGIQRRLLLTGLDHATLRFYPSVGAASKVQMLREPRYPFFEGDFLRPVHRQGLDGDYLEAADVSGALLISW
jgi:hypothetical protein